MATATAGMHPRAQAPRLYGTVLIDWATDTAETTPHFRLSYHARMSFPKAQLHKPVTCAMNACNTFTQFFEKESALRLLPIDMWVGKGGWMVTSRKVLPARPGCDRMEPEVTQQLQVRCETF